MALLSIEAELERSEDKMPFSNSTEGVGWMSIWCEECAHEPDCPLLLVSMMDRTPAAWELRDQASINRYTCTQYEGAEGGEAAPV